MAEEDVKYVVVHRLVMFRVTLIGTCETFIPTRKGNSRRVRLLLLSLIFTSQVS